MTRRKKQNKNALIVWAVHATLLMTLIGFIFNYSEDPGKAGEIVGRGIMIVLGLLLIYKLRGGNGIKNKNDKK